MKDMVLKIQHMKYLEYFTLLNTIL